MSGMRYQGWRDRGGRLRVCGALGARRRRGAPGWPLLALAAVGGAAVTVLGQMLARVLW